MERLPEFVNGGWIATVEGPGAHKTFYISLLHKLGLSARSAESAYKVFLKMNSPEP